MKLHYKSYGEGKPVIIMHGLFGSGDNWRTIATHLASDYCCIVVDMRNHGRSPHEDEMNFKLMSEDIRELVIDLGYAQVSLIGHSMGGKVAMTFALTYPELVDKLIVVDIAPKKYQPRHQTVIKAIEAVVPEQLNDRSEAEQILSQYLGDDQSTILFLMKNLTRLQGGGFSWKANMPVIISSYDQLVDEVIPGHIFKKPCLFIRGEQSRYIQDEDIPNIRLIFPAAEIKTISGAGHWVHADAPEAFVKIANSLLSS